MRSSRYNYIVNDGDSVIFFNGISESFFRVDPTRKNIYQEILNFPDDYSAKFSDFIARMKNQGFIVDNDTDERGLVVNKMQYISFFLAKVWQEDEDAIDESKIKSLYSQSNGLGLKTRFSLYGMCYVDWTNFECVYPNGYVGLCDNNPPDENPGRLMPDGTVAWPTKINCGKPAFETESAPCLQCRYHPICGGPCPAKRQRMLEHSGRITCQLQNPEKEMSENIRRICYSIDSLYNN